MPLCTVLATRSRLWIHKGITPQCIDCSQQIAQEAGVGVREEAQEEDQQVEAILAHGIAWHS